MVPLEIKDLIREGFKNTIIPSGGYDRSNAETDIELGLAGLVAFGRPFTGGSKVLVAGYEQEN